MMRIFLLYICFWTMKSPVDDRYIEDLYIKEVFEEWDLTCNIMTPDDSKFEHALRKTTLCKLYVLSYRVKELNYIIVCSFKKSILWHIILSVFYSIKKLIWKN